MAVPYAARAASNAPRNGGFCWVVSLLRTPSKVLPAGLRGWTPCGAPGPVPVGDAGWALWAVGRWLYLSL
jgi:hypothetical protein